MKSPFVFAGVIAGLVLILGWALLRPTTGAFAQTFSMPGPPMLEPAPGTVCTLQFRRDALGLASRTVVPQSAPVFSEADLTLRGVYRQMDEHWIVLVSLSDEERLIWVPREVVLTIEAVMP